jgi:hypothetical protein
MTNDRLSRVRDRHRQQRLGYRLLAIRLFGASLRRVYEKKPRAIAGARSGFSQPTKESFLAAGLSLAHPGNVLLNRSISLLLKGGQRLLLLRRQNRLQKRREFCALS